MSCKGITVCSLFAPVNQESASMAYIEKRSEVENNILTKLEKFNIKSLDHTTTKIKYRPIAIHGGNKIRLILDIIKMVLSQRTNHNESILLTPTK